jgi:ATP-dependent helicase/nuclease subunit B
LWDLASRELAICKGIQEWRRLRNFHSRDLVISQLGGDDEARVIRVPSAQLRFMADTVDGLGIDLLALAKNDSWSSYAAAHKELLRKYLGFSIDETAVANGVEGRLMEKILSLLDQIAGLDAVRQETSLSDFSQTFEHWLERSTLETNDNDIDGVTVLNATAARALSFRALFILGLNEGVFPRTIREDAFLRDRDRDVLERDLGYKINPKLAGFDEEKLVFTLLANAARERLYLSFQRADESGRALSPSWYIGEFRRALGDQAQSRMTEITIPRSLIEKSCAPPFQRDDLLLPEELGIRLTLAHRDPGALIDSFTAVPMLYRQGRNAVAELDQSGDKLRAFDGVVGPLDEHWRRFVRRGVSPTALETYARCPYQFFARHVLGLERLERPEDIAGPSPADYGELGHAILNGIYQSLVDMSYFAGHPVDIELTVETVAQRIFADYESNKPVGYALAWQSLKEQLTQVIRHVVQLDLQEMTMSGFAPAGFETAGSRQLPDHWPEPLRGMAIRGRMDRIDFTRDHRRLRVIDYKFKFSAAAAAQDRNLDRSALRGERLQPPFYSLLGASWARQQTEKPVQVDAEFYYIAPRWADGPLVTAAFSAHELDGKLGAEIAKTIAYLAGGIRAGRFFIQRGAHCEHGDVAEICRKNHPPSLWRAENDPVTKPHREIKDKDPKHL